MGEGGARRGLGLHSLADVQQLLQVGCSKWQRAQHAPDVEWNADHLHVGMQSFIAMM